MRPERASLPATDSLPVVGRAFRLGVNPVTTSLVLLGPVLIAVVAVVGRSPATTALGVAYILSVPASVAYFALTGRDPSSTDGTDGDAGGDADDEHGGDEGSGADDRSGEGSLADGEVDGVDDGREDDPSGAGTEVDGGGEARGE